MAEEAGVDFVVRTDQAIRALQQLPEEGGRAAKGLAKAAERELKALERATAKEAKAAAKAAERELKAIERATAKAARAAAREMEQQLDTIKRGSEKVFGGVIGDVEDVGKGLMALGGAAGGAAAAFGVAGLAVGAFTVGVVKGVEALFSFVDGGQAAVGRLKEIGGTEPLPQETIDALQAWTDGALGMEIAGKRLEALLAGELASAFGDLPYTIAGVADQFSTITEYAGTFDRTLTALGYTMAAIDLTVFGGRVLALGEAFALATEDGHRLVAMQKNQLEIQKILKLATEQTTQETEASRNEQREMAEALGMVIDLEEDARWKTDQLAEAKRDQAGATRVAAAALREEEEERKRILDRLAGEEAQLNANAKATDDLRAIATTAASDTLTAEGKVYAAYVERKDAIDALTAAGGSMDAAAAAHAANEERRTRDLMAVEAERSAAQAEQAEQMQANAEDLAASIGELISKWKEAQLAAITEAVSAVGDLGDSLAGIHQQITDAQIDNLGQQIEGQEAAADSAVQAWTDQQTHYVDQALALGQIDQAEADRRMAQIAAEGEAKRAALESQSDAEKKRITELWKQQQKAAAAMVPIHIAEGLLKSTATLGPPVPPNFVGIAGAAAVVAEGIAEGLAISAAKPPSFPMGGRVDPDHHLATIGLQDGEEAYVANRRGQDQIRRANEGRMAEGQPIVINLGRRTLATAFADVAGRAALDPRRGTRDPWGR